MNPPDFHPVFRRCRGKTVESVHFGAIAVVDVHGNLIAWHGNPHAVTFLRSTAKPFQALPFIEQGGAEVFNLHPQEIALICASHSGTDEHLAALQSLQAKSGVSEDDLLCGVHPPMHKPTAEALQARGEEPTPNRHNCSGKHSGMLAFCRLKGWPTENYLDPNHPVQQHILHTLAEMADLPLEQIKMGTDGCSAPNFALPLYHTALAFARLCDPTGLPATRTAACRTITQAMIHHPDMVAGPERFDTLLMQTAGDRLIAKGGAEGYQGIGLLPGALRPDSPGIGIALKISDGDARRKVVPAVALEVLRQLDILSPEEHEALAPFGPDFPVHNWRKLTVGQGSPCFRLHRQSAA